MKNIASFLVFALLFLGLGALALFAAPEQLNQLAGAAVGENSTELAALVPEAQAATTSFNFVALPLDASASIDPFTAAGLAAYQGDSVQQVLRWNPAQQTFDSYVPGVSPPFADFSLEVAGSYFLEVDATAGDVFTTVGDVPAQGSISFDLTLGASPNDCAFNSISIPLDRSDITVASELAADIGGTEQVLSWNATNQSFDSYVPGVSPPFADFQVKIGYPYFICVDNGGPVMWP